MNRIFDIGRIAFIFIAVVICMSSRAAGISIDGFFVGDALRSAPEYCSLMSASLSWDDYSAGEGGYDDSQSRSWEFSATRRFGCASTPDDLLLPMTVNSCWRRDGRLYAARYGSMSMPSHCEIIELDDEGTVVAAVDLGVDPVALKICYVDDEDMLYSWGYGAGTTSFAKSSPIDPSKRVKIAEFTMPVAQRPSSLAYCPVDGKFYYTDNSGRLGLISAAGEISEVRDVMAGDYQGDTDGMRDNRGGTALIWSDTLNGFLWSYPSRGGDNGKLCLIPYDISKPVETVVEFDGDKFYSAFLTPAEEVSHAAPAPVQISQVDFTPGDRAATVSYRLPSVRVDGKTLVERLEWKASVDGETVNEGSADPGAVISVLYEGLERGEHTLALMATCGGLESEQASVTRYFGFGTPLPVSWVRMAAIDGESPERCEASWPATSGSMEGAPLDEDNLVYDIFLDGELMYAGIREERCVVTLPVSDRDMEYIVGVRVRTPEGLSDITYAPPYGLADVENITDGYAAYVVYDTCGRMAGRYATPGALADLQLSPGVYLVVDSVSGVCFKIVR